jgi:hypothetical protein
VGGPEQAAAPAAGGGQGTPDAAGVLGHIADPSRLRVFAAVVLDGPVATSDVAARARVGEAETLRTLARLEAAGLVSRDAGGWAARLDLLQQAMAAAAPPRDLVDHGDVDPGAATVLRTFMPSGRLEQIPAARSKRLVVLDHVCRVFEPGTRYTEREVSALLRAFHPDFAALRRYLVDEGFLTRADGLYWRSGGTVDA